MNNIILLEKEEDIRLAAKIVARNRGINLQVYENYNDYKNNIKDNSQDNNIIFSSDTIESKKHNLYYIKKPYTASELLELINKVI